jgi:CHAD domain-containing protein
VVFRLTRDASAPDGLRRAVKNQLDSALEALSQRTPDERAVHEARRRVKRIRAAVRLLDGRLGSAGRRVDRRLRDAGRALSSVRDADASEETLQALRGRYASVVNRRIARQVSRGLLARKGEARKVAGPKTGRARAELRRLRGTLPRRVRRAAHGADLLVGLAEGYRRARKPLSGISLDSDATEFHDWRRRVKAHAIQVGLLAGLHAAPRARARALKRLDEWLGEDHNHAVLRATILASPERFGRAAATTAILGSIVKRQAHLRDRAIRLGRRLFSAKPRSFRKKGAGWLP